MQNASVLKSLQTAFGPEKASGILRALKVDALVWRALDDDGLARKIETCKVFPKTWSPAGIVWLKLLPLERAEGLLTGMEEFRLDAELLQLASQEFETLMRNGTTPRDIRSAGWQAVWLLTLEADGWKDLGNLLAGNTTGFIDPLETWMTSFSIVLGWVKDRKKLLHAMLQYFPQEIGARLWTHAVAADPSLDAEQSDLLVAYLRNVDLETQVIGLRTLSRHFDQEKLREIALQIVDSSYLPTEICVSNSATSISKAKCPSMLELGWLSELYEFAGLRKQAKAALLQARADGLFWLGGLEARREASITSDDEVSKIANDEMAVNIFRNNLPAYLQVPLDELRECVELETEGSFSESHLRARTAINWWIQRMDVDNVPLECSFSYGEKIHEFFGLVDELGLYQEGWSAIQFLLKQLPSDCELLKLASSLAGKSGHSAQAINLAQQVVILSPEDSEALRVMAQTYSITGEHELAYTTMKEYYRKHEQPEPSQSLELARYALDAKKYDEVLDIIAGLINQGNDQALALAGRARAAIGELEAGQQLLEQAILLNPEIDDAWLEISKIQAVRGDRPRAVDTLKAGLLANPESASLNVAIASLCVEMGDISEGLPYLRKAYQLIPGDQEVTLNYLKTLQALHFDEELRVILDEAYSRWPTDAEINYFKGIQLLSDGNRSEAEKYLEFAASAEVAKSEWCNRLAWFYLDDEWDAHMGETLKPHDCALEKIRVLTAKALQIAPDDAENKLAAAEEALLSGRFEESIMGYRAVLTHNDQPDFFNRCSGWLGLGLAELENGDARSALDSLKQAIENDPDGRLARYAIVKAYLALGMKDEAIEAAQVTLDLEPENPTNLLWFADVMIDLGMKERAMEAIDHLEELGICQPERNLQLSELMIKAGESEKAITVLSSLSSQTISALSEDQWIWAGRLYHELGDSEGTLTCVKQAITLSKSTKIDFQIAAAGIEYELGRFANACQRLNIALQDQPEIMELYLLRADTLLQDNSNQAALADLQRIEYTGWRDSRKLFELVSFALPARWLYLLNFPAHSTHLLMIDAYERLGNLPMAFDQALKGATAHPESLEIKSRAVKMGLSLMEFETVLQLTDNVNIAEMPEEIVASRCQTLLEKELAAPALDMLEQYQAENPSYTIVMNRVEALAVLGKVEEAEALFAQNHEKGKAAGLDALVATGRAALVLGYWGIAIRCFEQAAQMQPKSADNHFNLARALVLCGEFEASAEMLRVKAHRLEEPVLADYYANEFDQAILSASRITKNPIVQKWSVRGNAVFHTTPQTIRELSARVEQPDEVAALMLALRRSGNPAAAVQAAQRAPAAPEVLLQLGLSYPVDEAEVGLKVVLEALRMTPTNPMLHAAAAHRFELLGDLGQALEAIEGGLELWQNEPDWHAWAGSLAQRLGNFTAAVQHWEAAHRLQPKEISYALGAGQAYLAANNAVNAAQLLELASEMNPESYIVWEQLAEAHFQLGNLKRALACSEKAIEFDPDSCKSWMIRGAIELQAGNSSAALAAARAAFEKKPGDEEVVHFLVYALSESGESNEALRILSQVEAEKDLSAGLSLQKIKLLRTAHGKEAALAAARQYAEKWADSAEIAAKLAELEEENEHFDLAEKAALAAVRIRPEMTTMHLLLGRRYRATGQLDQAVFHLNEAIKIEPVEVEPYLMLADVYRARREAIHAMRVYQNAMKAAPRDARPYYEAGILLREAKDYQQAEWMMRKAAENAPKDINIRRQLAAIIALNLVQNTQEVHTP